MKSNGIKRVRVVLILLFLIIILIGGYTAYANKDSLINSYYLITKSPSDYYTYIEQYGLYRLLSADTRESEDPNIGHTYDISSEMTFHHKELDSALDTILDTNLTDLEYALGIPFERIRFDLLLASNGTMYNNTASILLNDTNLISAQLFLNQKDRILSLRMPELSEASLTKVFRDDIPSQYIDETQSTLRYQERMKRIAGKYTDLYFSRLGNVTLDKQVPLTLDSIVTKANLLTIRFTKEEAKEFYLAFFRTARADEDLLAMLPSFYVTEEQYRQALGKFEQLVNINLENTPPEATLQMKLYVDHKGHILSREITSFGLSALGYTFLQDKDYQEYEVHLSHAATNHRLRINGKNRRLGTANQGKMTLRLNAPSITASPELILDITYEDLQSIIHDGNKYLEGSFTLSTEQLAGVQITSDFRTDGELQLNTTDIRLGASSLATINSSCKTLTDDTVSIPEDASPQYDFTLYEDYLATINPDDYLKNLADSLGTRPDAIHELLTNVPAQ